MKFNLEKKVEEFLKIITKIAQTENVRVFFVGGIVRDNYLNKAIKDIDLIIEGNVIEFSKKLPAVIEIKSIHQDFATVKVEFDGLDIDIASTRTESYPYPAALPCVDKIGVKIEQDYKRRDFSVNSLYCEILFKDNNLEYKLYDFCSGINDIDNKTLKVLHKNSYIDDPTRIIRGLNFKHRFNFDFSEVDKQLIAKSIVSLNLENASTDRILSVFIKTLQSDFHDEIFKEIIEKKYYKLLGSSSVEVDFARLQTIIEKLNLKKEEKAELFIDILLNKKPEGTILNSKLEEYKYYSKLKNSKLALELYFNDDENILTYKNAKIFLTGKDLISMNFSQGKIIGEILDKLLLEKIENPDKFLSKDDEICWVKTLFPKK